MTTLFLEHPSLQGKPVLVFGASSQIGRYLLPLLMRENTRVLAVSRAARVDSGCVQWMQGSLPDACPDSIGDARALVSYGPLLAFAQWLDRAASSNVRRVIATSSMSAYSKQHSPVAAERAVAQGLRDAETLLASTCDKRGITWTILRPTLIYGAGTDYSLTPIARRAWRWRIFPLPAGSGLRQPVHAQDIAFATFAALRSERVANRIVPIGGGERITAAQMFARVRASLPVKTLPLSIPAFALQAARMSPRLRGPLSRLDGDLIADNTDLETLLDVHPRAFHPDAASWGL